MHKRSAFISLLLVILSLIIVINTTGTFATDDESTHESSITQQQEETTDGSEDDSPTTSEIESTISTKKVPGTHTITKFLKTFSSVQNITLEKGKATRVPSALSGNLKYDSGNPNIASVSSSGIVRANGIGTTYIRVYNDEFVQNFQITVSAPKKTETDTTKETETETSKNETVVLIVSNENSTSAFSESVTSGSDNASARRNLKIKAILVTVLALTALSIVAFIIYRRISSKDEDYDVDFETNFAIQSNDAFTDNSGVPNKYVAEEPFNEEEADEDFDNYDDDNEFVEEDDDDIYIDGNPDDSEDTFLL